MHIISLTHKYNCTAAAASFALKKQLLTFIKHATHS